MNSVFSHLPRAPLALAFTLLVGLTGCSELDKEPPLVPVGGRVTLGPDPLANGTVTFHPDQAKGNTSKWTPTGMIEASGQYKLMTNNKEGAPVGWYKVTVNPRGMTGMKGTEPNQVPKDPSKAFAKEGATVNPKFQKPDTTGLSIEVTATATAGAYDLKVTK